MAYLYCLAVYIIGLVPVAVVIGRMIHFGNPSEEETP